MNRTVSFSTADIMERMPLDLQELGYGPEEVKSS